MEELSNKIDEILSFDKLIKVVVSNKLNSTVQYNKVVFALKEKNKKEFYQIEKYTDKQVFHENIETNKLKEKLIEIIKENYKQVAAWSENNTFDLKISKKGKMHLSKKRSDNKKLVNKSHNKEKITY